MYTDALLTSSVTAPLVLSTLPYPAATSITNAIYPIIPIPPFTTSSKFLYFIQPGIIIVKSPSVAEYGSDLVIIEEIATTKHPIRAPHASFVILASPPETAPATGTSLYSLSFPYRNNTQRIRPISIDKPPIHITFDVSPTDIFIPKSFPALFIFSTNILWNKRPNPRGIET